MIFNANLISIAFTAVYTEWDYSLNYMSDADGPDDFSGIEVGQTIVFGGDSVEVIELVSKNKILVNPMMHADGTEALFSAQVKGVVARQSSTLGSYLTITLNAKGVDGIVLNGIANAESKYSIGNNVKVGFSYTDGSRLQLAYGKYGAYPKAGGLEFPVTVPIIAVGKTSITVDPGTWVANGISVFDGGTWHALIGGETLATSTNIPSDYGSFTVTEKYLSVWQDSSLTPTTNNIYDTVANNGAGPVLELVEEVEEKPIIKRKKNMQIVIAHSGKHWLTFGPLVTSGGVPINGRAAYGFESAKMIIGAGGHSSPATEITEDINSDLYPSGVSGCYVSEFDTTLWATPGYYRLVITDTPTNMIPHTEEILVIPQAVYDAFITGDIINANNYIKSSLYEAQSAGAVDLTEHGVASEATLDTLRDRIEVVQSWVSQGQSMGMTWYVDSVNGDDINDGKSVGSAFKTINKAITLTSPNSNSIIFVSYGSYYEDIIVPVGCTIRGVANDSTPFNPFPEIRGYAISEYPNVAATSDPTVKMLAGSTLSHVRIGRKESSALPQSIITMHDETRLEHCSMGGINPTDVPANIILSGYNCLVSDCTIDTSTNTLLAISAAPFASVAIIKDSIFTGGGEVGVTTRTTNYIKLTGNTSFNISDNTFNDVSQGYWAIDGTGNFNVVTFNHHNGYLALGLINPAIGSNVENNGSWVTTDNLVPITSELDLIYDEVVKTWQSTSGLAGSAMRGTDNVGSISADILATNTTLYKSGTTIKDIEVRDNTVYLTYRDPADGKMKTYSRPFTQDIIIASGGSL